MADTIESASAPKTCHACYNSFSGWWCDNCDTWPCTCVQDEEEELNTDD